VVAFGAVEIPVMLTKHASRVCTFFAVDFDPRFGPEVSSAASQVYEEHRPPHFKAGSPLTFWFGWPETRNVFAIAHSRLAWQTLGFTAWNEGLEDHLGVIGTALRTMHVSSFKRIGFKTAAYLPLSMSHAEMCKLMFGAFAAPEEELCQVLQGGRGPLLQIEGESHGMKYALVVTSFDRKQASKNFLSLPNLDLFRDNKYLDNTVKEFHDLVTESDCFYVDIDLFQLDVEANCLETFVKESLATAERATDSCVRRLCSKPQDSEGKTWRSSR